MPGQAGSQLAESWAALAAIPILGVLIGLIFRNKTILSVEILRLNKELAEYKLDNAKNLASNGYVKEVEDRLTKLNNKTDEKHDEVLRLLTGKLDEVLRRIK